MRNLSRPLSVLVSLLAVAGSSAAQSQATTLRLGPRSGQTVLTWKEAAASPGPEAYNVYRSILPIRSAKDLAGATLGATVARGSYWNARAKQGFVLRDLATPLKPGDAFLVVTASTNRSSYYAVLAVTNRVENRVVTVGPGGNSAGPVRETVGPPRPVLQSVTNNGRDAHYVHFLPPITTSAVQAQTNREGRTLNYRVYYDKTLAGPRPVFVFLHARSGDFRTAPLTSLAGPNSVQIFLDDENAPGPHSLWFGHHEDFGRGPPRKSVQDYTERRILWTLDQVLADRAIGADRSRVYCFGVSLGAMGAFAMGRRYPNVFAATAGVVPAFGLTHGDFSLKAEVAALFGTPAQNLPTNLGDRIYDLFDGAAQLGKQAVKGTAPMFFTVGRADTVVGWTEKPAAFRASYAARQPIAFYWDARAHATTGAWSTLETTLFRELSQIHLDRPLPAFTNLSLDDDPGPGDRFKGDLTGTMGGYVHFDPATALDTAAKVTLDVGLESDPSRLDYAKKPHATVDLTWRRLAKFQVKAGSYYRVRTRRKGQTTIEEERIVSPDARGLLTVRALGVERVKRTVDLEPHLAVLPEVHFGGETVSGGTLATSLLAAKNQFAILTIGATETRLKTPFGIWRILDPIFMWGGVTPASGQVEVLVAVPGGLRLGGVRILGQAVVGSRLTNLARVTFR